jgi:hypothetical protein
MKSSGKICAAGTKTVVVAPVKLSLPDSTEVS